jgi:hypothetical protein
MFLIFLLQNHSWNFMDKGFSNIYKESNHVPKEACLYQLAVFTT